MDAAESLETIGEIASQQWGLCTAKQARAEGVTPLTLSRLETRGGLIRVRHGVYATVGTMMSPALDVKAQWLALRPEMMAADRVHDPTLASESVISHTTAAELWGIGDLWPDGIHFTVNRRRQSRQPEVQFHRNKLDDHEWTLHPEHNLPITTAARTIVDLALDGHEPQHLLDLIADASEKQLLQEPELLSAFAGNETAFGLPKGDQEGLRMLWKECFPPVPAAIMEEQIQRAVAKALEPFAEELKALAAKMPLQTDFHSSNVEEALQNMLAGRAATAHALEATHKQLAETIVHSEGLKTLWLSTPLPPSHTAKPQGESCATTSKTKGAPRSDRFSTEEGSKPRRKEAKRRI